MKPKQFASEFHLALIEFEAEDGGHFRIKVKVGNWDKQGVSYMEGTWHPDEVREENLNIQWRVPITHLENVRNSRDFKLILQKALSYANEFCWELIEARQSNNTGGDQFGF